MKIQRMISMEFLGTAILAVAIVGSGHMAINLQADSGMVLLINALATAMGLALVIKIGMKVSGSHFNPAVTLIMLLLKKMTPQLSLFYITAQIVGAIAGVGFANLLFGQKALDQSSIERSGSNLFFSEIFATAILLWIILRFPKRDDLIAVYVPLWIFGAILFTSSTSFANPAITIGRIFTNSVVGIAPESVIAFILAQLIGASLGFLAAKNITNASKVGNE